MASKNVDLAKCDVVYFVKEASKNEELRYSIRSVEQNLPHRNIWIAGGIPECIRPTNHIRTAQSGASKWDKVRSMFRKVCLDPKISDNFILFNDDFFIMKPIEELEPVYRCSLYEHIVTIEMKYHDAPNDYTRQLRGAVRELKKLNKPCMSYELHTPMLLNKVKLLEVLGAFPNTHCTRSLYGNYHEIGGERMDDVKVFSLTQNFNRDSELLSTEDTIFETGEIGRLIREKFTTKSKLEK